MTYLILRNDGHNEENETTLSELCRTEDAAEAEKWAINNVYLYGRQIIVATISDIYEIEAKKARTDGA